MPAPTSAFGNLQLRPRTLPNPGQTAQLSGSAAAGWGACPGAARSPGHHSPLPRGRPPRSLPGNPPLSTGADCTQVRGTWPRCAEGKISHPAPALASILIACDELMAPGPTEGQRLPKRPVSSQAAPRHSVFPAGSRKGRVPPPIPPGFWKRFHVSQRVLL